MGFVDLAQKAFEPLVLELKWDLADGQPMAIRCRPLVTVDYFSMPNGGFGSAIPILTGKKSPEDLSPEEQVKMYLWFREIVKSAIVGVRDTDDDGATIWRSVHLVPDAECESPWNDENGVTQISVRAIERLNGGDITELAASIIQRTNESRELEVAKRRPR